MERIWEERRGKGENLSPWSIRENRHSQRTNERNKIHYLLLLAINEEVYPVKPDNRYSEILQQYPRCMTKEQMYQVCHISKKTCLYLLESGLVPCRDSGKKTRRFTIETAAVIRYLEERELNRPRGIIKGKKTQRGMNPIFRPHRSIRSSCVSCMKRNWSGIRMFYLPGKYQTSPGMRKARLSDGVPRVT